MRRVALALFQRLLTPPLAENVRMQVVGSHDSTVDMPLPLSSSCRGLDEECPPPPEVALPRRALHGDTTTRTSATPPTAEAGVTLAMVERLQDPVTGRFVPGATVEYQSRAFGTWILAKVEGFDENAQVCRLDVQQHAKPERVRPPAVEAVAPHDAQVTAACSSRPMEALAAVEQAAVQTEAGDPAEILLVEVFRFWVEHGRDLLRIRRGQEVERGPTLFEEFVQDPPTVRNALKIWLRDAADLPRAVNVVPFLGLWFRDFEEPTPDEESHFYAQWTSYSKGKRLLARRRNG
jgi:hypothetical protein